MNWIFGNKVISIVNTKQYNLNPKLQIESKITIEETFNIAIFHLPKCKPIYKLVIENTGSSDQ